MVRLRPPPDFPATFTLADGTFAKVGDRIWVSDRNGIREKVIIGAEDEFWDLPNPTRASVLISKCFGTKGNAITNTRKVLDLEVKSMVERMKEIVAVRDSLGK